MAVAVAQQVSPASSATQRSDVAPQQPPVERANLTDVAAARAYGERAARVPGFAERVWEDVAPLLRAGWEGRHAEVCPIASRHDWRSSWPAVRDGWCGAGGRTLNDIVASREKH